MIYVAVGVSVLVAVLTFKPFFPRKGCFKRDLLRAIIDRDRIRFRGRLRGETLSVSNRVGALPSLRFG